MPHEHRVAGHLGVQPEEYDRTIRTFIPHYDRMLETIGKSALGLQEGMFRFGSGPQGS